MSILDKNIEERIDNTLILTKQIEVMECLRGCISHGSFAVLAKERRLIRRADKISYDLMDGPGSIPAYQVDYAVYYIGKVPFTYIDLVFDEKTYKWVITPRDLEKPVYMIFNENTLDIDGKIPSILTFVPGTKIFIDFKDRGVEVFKNEPERYEIVNPYSNEKYWIPIQYIDLV